MTACGPRIERFTRTQFEAALENITPGWHYGGQGGVRPAWPSGKRPR